MWQGRCRSYNHLSSLRDADKPEYPQISHIWRVQLADHSDMGVVHYLCRYSPHHHVFFPGLKLPKADFDH